jgi:hypothetical protein
MRRLLGWFLCVSWLATACQLGVAAAVPRGQAFEAEGLATVAPLEPAANPTAGAFFNDGVDGDVRGRSENRFGAPADQAAGFDEFSARGRSNRERMLVQRGDLAVEVARPEESARSFLQQVAAFGGYLQSQNGTRVVVRLPVQHFDAAFAAVHGLGRVLRESRSANDVTEEFVDLGIRLETARKSRERLLEVLAKAEKVEDILKVEAELRRLTEEIERMEGRRKFLADQVALATLAVEFTSVTAPPPPPKRRQQSRFEWIQRVGAEAMMEGF